MPGEVPRNNFPIGIHHYIDYLNANVNNQLNIFNIPPSRHQSPDDSDPGSPASGHGGARPGQSAVNPGQFGIGSPEHGPSPYVASPEDGPYIPAHTGDATSNNSAIRSTASPFPHQHLSSASDGSDRHPGSPTGSVHSDRSASRSVHSGYSGHSSHSVSSSSSYDRNIPQRQLAYPQQYIQHDDHGYNSGMDHGFSGPAQHYYRMGSDDYQGILAPEVLDADAPSPRSRVSPPLYTIASSSTSSTPATTLSHLPAPSLHPAPPTEAEQYLRHQLGLPRDQPVDLWALKDPANRQKPNQPYPSLIKLAIFGSPKKKLTLQEIYQALIDRFEWFKDNENEMAWKNSIRHNLSLNKVFVNTSRPITEPGKGSYWRLDLTKGEGYKRPRIRKSRAQQREAAAAEKQAAGYFVESEADAEVSPRTAPSTRRSPAAAGPIDDTNIDPQLRNQGHIVGERRTRATPRRPDTSSPYPLRKTPSPVPLVAAQLPRERNPAVSDHPSPTHSQRLGPLPHLQVACQFPEPSVPAAQPHYVQPSVEQASFAPPPFEPPSFLQSFRQPSFGQPSLAPPSGPGHTSPWTPPSAPSPAFSPIGAQALLDLSTARASPERGRENLKPEIEYITDEGLPRARRVPGASSRPTSRSPPDHDDGAGQRSYRGSTGATSSRKNKGKGRA